jgi:hypothetical protein
MNITWCKVFGCTLKTFTNYLPIELLNGCYKTEKVVCVKCGKVVSEKTEKVF